MPENKLNSTAQKITPPTASFARRVRMGSISGPRSATGERTTRLLETTFRATSPAMMTSMITALGARNRSTGMCGIPTMLARTGLLIATAAGTGSLLGDGLGWAMSLGVLRLTTTAAGHLSVAGGAGALGRSLVLQFMAPRS